MLEHISKSEKSVVQTSRNLALGLLASIVGSIFALPLDAYALKGEIKNTIVLKPINQYQPFRVYEVPLEHVEKHFTLDKKLLLQPWNVEHENVQRHQSNTMWDNIYQWSSKQVSEHLRSTSNSEIIDNITTGEDFFSLIRDTHTPKTKFTYVIMPNGQFRFSVVNLNPTERFSKHLMLSGVESEVLYAGEFSLFEYKPCKQLPEIWPFGKELGEGHSLFKEEITKDRIPKKIIIMDNNSGSYAPKNDSDQLGRLKKLFEENFKELFVFTHPYDDSEKNHKEAETGTDTQSI